MSAKGKSSSAFIYHMHAVLWHLMVRHADVTIWKVRAAGPSNENSHHLLSIHLGYICCWCCYCAAIRRSCLVRDATRRHQSGKCV